MDYQLRRDVLDVALAELELERQTLDTQIRQVRELLGVRRVGRPSTRSVPKIGRRLSPEARARISRAQKLRWARVKGKVKTAK